MPDLEHIRRLTPHQDINDVLYFLSEGTSTIFTDDLVGIYLTGSLSYGDFDPGRSDIDLAVIIKKPATAEQIRLIAKLHEDCMRISKVWGKRLECSYIPLAMMKNILPPEKPRPYFGDGIFYEEALYGNEWIINQYFLYNCGIAMIGPEFRTLIGPIDIRFVQEACIRDLHKEWEPRIADSSGLADNHLSSYIVLNLCRILFAVKNAAAVSKKKAAAWAMKEYPAWKELIRAANDWHYGIEMGRQEEKIINFIRFALSEVER